jgi:hypothetical protein
MDNCPHIAHYTRVRGRAPCPALALNPKPCTSPANTKYGLAQIRQASPALAGRACTSPANRSAARQARARAFTFPSPLLPAEREGGRRGTRHDARPRPFPPFYRALGPSPSPSLRLRVCFSESASPSLLLRVAPCAPSPRRTWRSMAQPGPADSDSVRRTGPATHVSS